ncbi:MAG: hypothetical protein M8357_10025 [Desulfobulbaceae bacterium]|nr:hypothetical protein [Desulfobulbaceae bacterium]
MINNTIAPQTYLAHPNHNHLREFFQALFQAPFSHDIAAEAAACFGKYPLPMADFPRVRGAYSRTILYRADNKFEALAARWSKGYTTVIHGHPDFLFDYIVDGDLAVQNFALLDGKLQKTVARRYRTGEHFSVSGREGAFANGIHQVTVLKESLSLHIYSDNALLGRVFDEQDDHVDRP